MDDGVAFVEPGRCLVLLQFAKNGQDAQAPGSLLQMSLPTSRKSRDNSLTLPKSTVGKHRNCDIRPLPPVSWPASRSRHARLPRLRVRHSRTSLPNVVVQQATDSAAPVGTIGNPPSRCALGTSRQVAGADRQYGIAPLRDCGRKLLRLSPIDQPVARPSDALVPTNPMRAWCLR